MPTEVIYIHGQKLETLRELLRPGLSAIFVGLNPSPVSAAADDSGAEAEAKFLRLAHDGGCKMFSTVLGPEANDAHRSHLHMDLQDRKTPVCK